VKGRVTAYVGYQLRDYFATRALTILVATALVAWGFAAARGVTFSELDPTGGVDARERIQQAFELLLVIFAFVAGAAAAHGLVSHHRSREYDRLLFSRPINPARYYSQGFVLAGLGGVVLAIVGAEVYAVAVHPVSLAGVAGYVALAWVLVGGLAFLLSTLTAFHLPILALVLAADLAVDYYAGELSTAGVGPVAAVIQYVLPPAHVLVTLRGGFARGLPIDPRAVAWPAGFGVACIVVAMVLLRRRPFRP
jgi:ABC-type transport system involved in multi-copper enzyme maturation permease subunit